jgi:O-antigen ligase/Flp pilus assembly protein TadD
VALLKVGEPKRDDAIFQPLHALMEVGWLLIALLIPLAVNLWAQQPFEPSKAALLRTIVWAMVGLWLAGGLLERRNLWREVTATSLFWPATAVVLAQTLATLLSVEHSLSVWGSYERSQGWLTLLSYYLLFLLVAARLRTPIQADHLVQAVVVTAVPLVVLSTAQALGWAPLALQTDARSPVYATLGRANFLGAYLALLLPLTLALGCTARAWPGRLAAAVLLGGEVVLIGLTRARAAWLAAGAALALFGGVWFWSRLRARGRTWQVAVVTAGALCLIGGLAVALWAGRAGGSPAARLTIWRVLLPLLAHRPLLGYGPDTLELVFPAVYPPELVYYQGRGILVDRAHNLLLDWAMTTGVIGVLAQSVLFASFFGLTWRAAQRAPNGRERALLAGCLAAVGGAVVGNLVSFDVTATATATVLLFSLGVGLARLSESRTVRSDAQQLQATGAQRAPWDGPARDQTTSEAWAGLSARAGPAAAPRRLAVLPLLLMIMVGVSGAVWQANVRPIAADMAARVAEQHVAAEDWWGARRAAERAVAWWPFEPAYRRTLSWIYLQGVLGPAATGSADTACTTGGALQCRSYLIERAEAELLAARDLRPREFRTWAALGELYGVWGNRWDAARLPLAHQAYVQATGLAPGLVTLYTAWGMVDLAGGRFAPAAVHFRRAVDLDATDGYAFAHLGEAELGAGHNAEAAAAFEQAVRWAPDLAGAYVGLARALWLGGQPHAAGAAVTRALALDPTSPAALALRQEINGQP